MECGGVIRLEQPGQTFDSLAVDPSAMRKKRNGFIISEFSGVLTSPGVSRTIEMDRDMLLTEYM